ncbi:MAG: hypothetical protein ACK5V3_06960 [Bdellovibrionales bacterium]
MNEEKKSSQVLKDFIVAFFVPTCINKMFMLYFGIKFSEFPGDGYGYGLAASVAFLIYSLGHLIWKYRNVEDP